MRLPADERVVGEVLADFTEEAFQAMASVLWNLNASDAHPSRPGSKHAAWLLWGDDPRHERPTDRSVRMLSRKAHEYLYPEAIRRGFLAETVSGDTDDAPPTRLSAADERQRRTDRCIRQLEEQPDKGALGAACAAAVERLRSGEFDAVTLDAELLDAARTVVPLDDLERQAHEKLARYRSRMAADDYDQALRRQVEQLLRERASLPDLSALGQDSEAAEGSRRAG